MNAHEFLMQRLATFFDVPFVLSSTSPWLGIRTLPKARKAKPGQARTMSALQWNRLAKGNAVLCDADAGIVTVFLSPGHVALTHPSQPCGAPPAGIRLAVLLNETKRVTKVKGKDVDTAGFAAGLRARGYLIAPPAARIESALVWGDDLWPRQPHPSGLFIWARFGKSSSGNIRCIEFSNEHRVCLGDAGGTEMRRYFDVPLLHEAVARFTDLSDPQRAGALNLLNALIDGTAILPPDPEIAAQVSAWVRSVPQDVHSRRFIRMRLAAPCSGKSSHSPHP